MPPRYVYWTILIDNKPTAFRAREKEDLLPTLAQLRRSNADVVMKWFARGRIWDSPEAEREAQQRPPAGAEKRGRDWRPGGMHKDPRDRFKRKKEGERQKFGPPREPRPWRDKPHGPAGPPRGDRPWSKPPSGPPRSDRPWTKSGRPPSGPPREGRPWNNKPGKPGRPPSFPPRGDRPWMQSKSDKPGKPPYGSPRGDRPWRDKPGGGSRGPQASRGGWQGKPRHGGRPFPRRDDRPPKKRDDEK